MPNALFGCGFYFLARLGVISFPFAAVLRICIYYYAEFLVSTQLEFDFLRFQWLELVKEQIILF